MTSITAALLVMAVAGDTTAAPPPAADSLHVPPPAIATVEDPLPLPASAHGRQQVAPAWWLVAPHGVDLTRRTELRTGLSSRTALLRANGTIVGETLRPGTVALLGPEFQLTANSALPFSVNDGPLWAGRGANLRLSAGAALRAGPLTMVFAPELIASQNSTFELRRPGFFAPDVPADRSEYTFPWYTAGPYSIDMPTRFGAAAVNSVHPGQSSIALRLGALEAGAATENQWWGPGISNALVLSNNAPGFLHLFLRPHQPLATPVGELDFRWLAGGLRESAYFDTIAANDLRSIAAGVVVLRPRRARGLEVGLARSVWGTSNGWSKSLSSWFDVFRSTEPYDFALADSTLYEGGHEQITSLFGRWVFAPAGVEIYAEWARAEFPRSLRDFLVAVNHSAAYTYGVHTVRPGLRAEHQWRFQAENTSVEQSPTFRERPLGVWYTSRRVIQGYTHLGQPLGAAVGPGSSGQNIDLDYFTQGWSGGVRVGRMRLNEDVRSLFGFPVYQQWCTHDVLLYWGARGSATSGLGTFSLDLTFGNRINAWYQVQSGCPRGDAMVDIRNQTLRLTFTPLRRR